MIRFRFIPVLIHIAAWLLFIILPLLFISSGKPLELQAGEIAPYVQFCALYIIIFYLHAYLLIPQVFYKKRILLYWATLLVLLFVILAIKPFDNLMQHHSPTGKNGPSQHRMPPPENPAFIPGPPPDPIAAPGHDLQRQQGPAMQERQFDITSVFVYLMVIGLGSALQSLRRVYQAEHRATLAEAEKASAELAFLKAQVNPHFLYNTLNNIYTLSLIGDAHAADSILKLSKIMRYVTDESSADFVPLTAEIDCISDYIALQQLRMGSKTTLEYHTNGTLTGKYIAPLIFMNIIENVFKYGLSNHLAGSIKINIEVTAEILHFYTENPLQVNKTPEIRKGTGLANTKRRLDYIYPNRYTLKTEEKDSKFIVNLNILF